MKMETCPKCGASNPASKLYCEACGASLGGSEARGKLAAQVPRKSEARREAQELESAWEAAKLRNSLRSSGGWNIFWGIVAILTALATVEQSGCNAVLLLLGLFLIGAGIAAWRSPGPSTLQANGVALLLVGGWNIGISLLALSAGEPSQSFWIVLGGFQVIWAIQRFAQSSKFGRVQHVPESTIARAESLVKQVQGARGGTAGDLITFRARSKNWKGQLAPEIVTLVAGNAQEVRFVPADEFALIAQGEVKPKKQVKVSVRVGTDTWTGKVPYESLQRYENWKSGLRTASEEEKAPTATPAPTSGEQKVICPHCGHENPSGYSFCTGCGNPLAQQPTPSPPVPELEVAPATSGTEAALESSEEAVEELPTAAPATGSGKAARSVMEALQSGESTIAPIDSSGGGEE
ncbi:MAG: zinc ribbon domain-containing protein [Anaerolineae bacterium]|nr:zinc ribbon domain-containing protein [Anaerolineae bacterium]